MGAVFVDKHFSILVKSRQDKCIFFLENVYNSDNPKTNLVKNSEELSAIQTGCQVRAGLDVYRNTTAIFYLFLRTTEPLFQSVSAHHIYSRHHLHCRLGHVFQPLESLILTCLMSILHCYWQLRFQVVKYTSYQILW